MKHFRYKIEDDEVKEAAGEVEQIPEGFVECSTTFGPDKIYCKIEDTKITEVIGEGYSEPTAKRRVEDFLSALNVNLF